MFQTLCSSIRRNVRVLAALVAANMAASGIAGAQQPTPERFHLQEARITDIQRALLVKEITSVGLVELYLKRIKAYNNTCVSEPMGILGPITTIPHARQVNALSTLNLRPAVRKAWGFDERKARSMTDAGDNDPKMPDALEFAAAQDRQLKRTGRLVGPLHGVVMAIKDQYDTFDLRTTSGADVQYANDRPPEDATFVKRLRDAGAIILAKANLAEYATDGARSSFGGTFCNPYDTEREPGMSSAGSAASVAANLVTCAIGEETVVSIRWPASVNSLVGLAPTEELVSRKGMMGAGLSMRTGPICRSVPDAARILDVIAGYDPKDELTAFSVGRKTAQPYLNSAASRRLDGLRIGVIREYMARKLFSKADEESIDIVDRAIEDLRKLGATIVDPRPGRRSVRCLLRAVRAGAPEQRVYPSVSGPVPGHWKRRRRPASIGFSVDAAGSSRGSGASAANSFASQPEYTRCRGRRQIHDEQVSAGTRRRQHQNQRGPDLEGEVLR